MAFQFEESMDKLKNIVNDMESEDINLEESLKTYAEGIKLYKKCAEFLEKSSRKVEILKNGQAVVEEEAEPQVSLFEDVE